MDFLFKLLKNGLEHKIKGLLRFEKTLKESRMIQIKLRLKVKYWKVLYPAKWSFIYSFPMYLRKVSLFQIDLAIDGADEIDRDLTCIKGGGGCHLQEKLLAYCAKNFVIIADSRKKSTKLGQNWHNGVPIEVLPLSFRLVQQSIERLYGGKAVLREFSGNGLGKAVCLLKTKKFFGCFKSFFFLLKGSSCDR